MGPMFKFLINIGLVLALAYVGKMVYDTNPTYGGYVILSLQWPVMAYSKELATAAREFIAALPSSRKRSLVCEFNSMSYKYILKWLNKAHTHHVINGLVVKDILPDGSMNVDIENQTWRICYIVKGRDFSCATNEWLDHVPLYTRNETFEITFLPADRYSNTAKRFVLTNKSYTRLTDLYRWCGLAYVDRTRVPRTAHRSINDDQLVDEYAEMYRSFTDRWGNLAAAGRAGAGFPRGPGKVGNGTTPNDSGRTAILIAAADRNYNRSGYPQTVNCSGFPHQ